MQIIKTSGTHEYATIIEAASDCGRITYNTFCDGPVIDGRSTWRGAYTQDGKPSGERVSADLWDAACDLMRQITDYNRKRESAARDARDDAYAARMDRCEQMSQSIRGFEDGGDM